MGHKGFLPLLIVLFVGLFLVLISSAAVPTSRSLKSFEDDPSVQDPLAQDGRVMRSDGELSRVEEVFIEGRMDIEESTDDYPGTGANNHHDPNTPARA